MAQSGQLVQWNDDRGFGFIETSDGCRHFVHISAITRIANRPRIGDRVSFVSGVGADGRLQAKAARIVGANPTASPDARRLASRTAAHNRGLDWRVPTALLLVGLLIAGWIIGNIPWQVVLLYAAMSGLSFLAYRSDKIFAETGRWRISEVTLQALDLCLGSPGGLLGQAVFRHKTRKASYAAATMLIAAVHALWLAGMASGLIDANEILPLLLSAVAGLG